MEHVNNPCDGDRLLIFPVNWHLFKDKAKPLMAAQHNVARLAQLDGVLPAWRGKKLTILLAVYHSLRICRDNAKEVRG